MAGDGHYNIFGRLCVLAGHYGDNVASLGENTFGQLTLKTLIDNYNYPFPIDAYYPMKANNIEYDMIHQEYLKAVRRTISMSSFSYSDILNKERSPNEILFFRVDVNFLFIILISLSYSLNHQKNKAYNNENTTSI